MSQPYRPVDQPFKRPYSHSRREDDDDRNGDSSVSSSIRTREDREVARQKRRRGALEDESDVAPSQHSQVGSATDAYIHRQSQPGRTGAAGLPTRDPAYHKVGNGSRSDSVGGTLSDRQSKAKLAESQSLRHLPSSSTQTPDAAAALSNDDDLDFDLEDEEAETRRIEEQRKRRRNLMAKYSEPPRQDATVIVPESSSSGPESVTAVATTSTAHSSEDLDTPKQPEARFDLSKSHSSLANQESTGSTSAFPLNTHADVSAADYNPVDDRRKDQVRQQNRLQVPVPDLRGEDVKASVSGSVADGIGEPRDKLTASATDDAGYESEYEEVEVDDEDDLDDMFAVGNGLPKKKTIRIKKSKAGTAHELLTSQPGDALPSHGGLTDNWDDSEGYYRIVLGEKIGQNGRFHVFANLGKGMFSEVVRAKDLGEDGKGRGEGEVAIKIVRSQETMYKAGLKEIGILKKLSALDPEDKRHIVRLISHFEHRGHLCMVFESLSMNLREVVKRFGKDVGLNLRAVRAYAHQMFLALSLMRKAEVMHADIKPDNILVNEAKTMLKVCDLGSASDTSEMEITPYLVSRFYRAPEVILGQPYDCSLDTWSIGCTLYELYTGKILFPGRSNNQMLLLMQELRGKFTTRQIRKGKFSGQHFDESNTFLSYDTDRNTGSETIRKVVLSTNAANDVRSRLLPASVLRGLSDDEIRLTQHFVDLLNKTLELDPAKRVTPGEALKHPFLT